MTSEEKRRKRREYYHNPVNHARIRARENERERKRREENPTLYQTAREKHKKKIRNASSRQLSVENNPDYLAIVAEILTENS